MSQLILAVPVFNAEEFLPATLESLNAQGNHIRWWLQDGASRDRTIEIARAFKRTGDTIVSEADSGQPDALNRAFSAMGGDIIGFLNGDDLLGPGTAERVIEYFRLHPHIDLIYGRVEWIDRNGAVTGSHTGNISSLDEILDIYNVWWKQRQWVQPEVFFRRSLMERAGPFDTGVNLAFDYDFWVRCFRAGARVAHVPAITVSFRHHPSQKSVAAERAADEIRAIVRKHLNAGARMHPWRKQVLRSNLSYDAYQLGNGTAISRSSFARAVLTHPSWILSSFARRRAWASFVRFTPFGQRELK